MRAPCYSMRRSMAMLGVTDLSVRLSRAVRERILNPRMAADPGREQAIALGGIVLDPSRQHVTVRGKEVALAPKEFALLDRDGDGKLTERELTTYLDEVQERQARLIAATPSLTR